MRITFWHSVRARIGGLALAVLAVAILDLLVPLALGLLVVVIEGVLRRLANLGVGASRIAGGEIGVGLSDSGTDEIGALGAALESMRGSLGHSLRSERLANKEATEQKAQTRAILDATADGIVTVDEHGLILDVNAAVLRLFGYEVSELLGQDVAMLTSSPYREEFPGYLARYLMAEEAEIVDLERLVDGRRKNGSTFPVELRVTELRRDGARTLIGTVRDITDRKLAEDTVRKSHQQFQAVLDNTPAAIYAKDTQGRYLIWNRMMETSFHRLAEDVLGHTDYEVFTPEHADSFAANDRRVIDTLAPLEIEEVAPHDDGPHTYISLKFPLLDVSGKAYAVCGISTDITDRKRSEAAILSRERQSAATARVAQLALSGVSMHKLLEAAAKSVGDALGVELCEVLEVLPGGQALRLICCPALETLAPGELLLPIQADCMFGHTLATRSTVVCEDLAAETRFCTEPIQRERGLASAVTVPILAEQGIFGVLCVSVARRRSFTSDDVRFLESVAATLAVAVHRERAEQALRNKDEQLRQSQKMEAGAAESATALTRQLLAFSRRQVLQPKLLDLNVVVADTEKMLRRLLGEDIVLEARLSARIGQVLADPGQLGQVLLNLAVNARDAMPTGGRLTIETGSVRQAEHALDQVPAGSYVLMSVSDTGCGIESDIKSHIFEPFFTTKEVGKGTGLGLSTVQGIVEQSGGHIRLSSEAGKGTQFRIYLPQMEGAPRRAAPALEWPEGLRGTETILIVEDDSALRQLARRILEQAGYTVLEACCGEEALSLLRSHEGPMHLLLSDVVMPGMSGRQIAEQVARTRPTVSVLYMSGYMDDAVLRHGISSSGAPLLHKPFAPAALVRMVRERIDAGVLTH
ncbi:MAG: PAS domain S-box protein [Candidatus Wallbacteria bacterium]|nr:PAS domain S-box protein [Candidatus Wallbacteria bacterium]